MNGKKAKSLRKDYYYCYSGENNYYMAFSIFHIHCGFCIRVLCVVVWCVFMIFLCFWPHNQPNVSHRIFSMREAKKYRVGKQTKHTSYCETVNHFLFVFVDFNFADFSFYNIFDSVTNLADYVSFAYFNILRPSGFLLFPFFRLSCLLSTLCVYVCGLHRSKTFHHSEYIFCSCRLFIIVRCWIHIFHYGY